MINYDLISISLLGPAPANPGLGNILFQVATLESLAIDNNCNVTFPDLKLPAFNNYHTNILQKSNVFSHNLTETYFHNWEYSPIPFLPNTIYKGYFQCEKYFLHHREFILQLFSKPNISYENVVSIHIRRGDFVNNQRNHPLLTLEYYKKAIELIQEKTDVNKAFVYSDDLEWCRHNLNLNFPLNFIDTGSDWKDLYHMSNCSHNIISNSTFSWWAAWLNLNENKIVISPKTWFGIDRNLSDKDIIPARWIRI